VKHVTEDYQHDYGTCVIAAASCGKAGYDYVASVLGMTGFQMSCVMWEMVQDLTHGDSPKRLIDYDNMLYPQYEYKFTRQSITPSTMEWLQQQAAEKIAEDNSRGADMCAHPDVRKHWEEIIAGVVPFGYVVGNTD
jgi:hypothetical protein